MDTKAIIELGAMTVMVVGIGGLAIERVLSKRGVGLRAIQFLGLILIFPAVLVLALEGILEKSAVGTMLGALIGYLFADVAKRSPGEGGGEASSRSLKFRLRHDPFAGGYILCKLDAEAHFAPGRMRTSPCRG